MSACKVEIPEERIIGYFEYEGQLYPKVHWHTLYKYYRGYVVIYLDLIQEEVDFSAAVLDLREVEDEDALWLKYADDGYHCGSLRVGGG